MKKLSFFILMIAMSSAFTVPTDAWLEHMRKQWQIYQENLPDEEVYLSVSEDVLAAGDTLWFGGYLRADEAASKVLYVELISGQRSLQKETYIVSDGFVAGQLGIPDSLSTGLYQLRAYTQWMRNDPTNTFFSRSLLVINAYDENPPIPGFGKMQSDRLQLEPEGGQWIRGLPARLRVSLEGKDNQSFRGSILKYDSIKITEIRLEKGIDRVRIKPEDGASYRAEVYLPSGDTLRALLPSFREEGVSLMADLQGDLLTVRTYTRGNDRRYLMVRSRDKLLHSSLLEDSITSLTMPADMERAALVEVAVLNTKAEVLAERLLYYQPTARTVEVQLRQSAYSPRDEVTATLSLPEGVNAARVSVRIRKIPGLSMSLEQEIGDRWSGTWGASLAALSQEMTNRQLIGIVSPFTPWQEILKAKPKAPKFRKEDEYFLLSGTLSGASGDPLPGQMTLLSVPGYNPHFDYDRTDSLGKFYIPVYDVYGRKEVVFQTEEEVLDAKWMLEDKFAPPVQESQSRQGAPMMAKEAWSDLIAQFRQRAQIQTQYSALREMTDEDIPRKSRFYGEPNFTVKLEEYIALPDFVEVCRELMPGIRLRKEDDHYVFNVFDVRTRTFLENPPALLLDGVLIQDPDKVVSLRPSEIDRIETVNRRTYYGEYRFDGMIAVYTKTGDAYLDALPAGTEQRSITFLTPKYPFRSDPPAATFLPDFRTLLYWKPAMNLEAGQPQQINFRNADELGRFEIVIEGITKKGHPVSTKTRYTVDIGQAP